MKPAALTRLRIWTFSSAKFEETKDKEPFELQVNPESFSISSTVEYG